MRLIAAALHVLGWIWIVLAAVALIGLLLFQRNDVSVVVGTFVLIAVLLSGVLFVASARALRRRLDRRHEVDQWQRRLR